MSLFNKPAWAKSQTVTSNADEAHDDIFSHSERSFRDIVAERERKKRARLERQNEKKRVKEERKSLSKREILDESHGSASSKRRRISLPDEDEGDEDEGGPVLNDLEGQDGVMNGTTDGTEDMAETTGHKKSPLRRSPRKNKDAITAAGDLTWEQNHDVQVLELLDSDSDDEDGKAEVVRPPPPATEVLEEESDDEFAALARRAREQRQKGNISQPSQTLEGRLLSPNPGQGVLDTGQARAASIDLPDPTVELFVSSRLENTNPMIVFRKLSQDIAQVRKVWCARQGFSAEETKDVFFIHRMRRVYDVTTCRSLGLEVDSLGMLTIKGAEGKENVEKVHLEAVTEELFRQMKADRLRKVQRPDDELHPEAGADDDEAVPEEPKEALLRLVLKAKGKEDLKLKVKPETTFAKIMTAYVKQRLDANQSARLEFDGETLDPNDEVHSTEISDKDCIDVYVTSN